MSESGPFMSAFLDIEADWIDYNDHLNMGYYTVLFDRAADELWARIGFGPDYVAATNYTTFSAEFHVRYLREVKLGDSVRCTIWVIDHDAKRFHTFQEMFRDDGTLVATGEGLTLHVDRDGPKVAPMPPHIRERLAALATAHAAAGPPEGVGRRIGIPRKA